ncbi:hydroxyacylglutathione hydrolase [Pikeienuella piscinae]|uniref:Hydroxyacylglutathione hydrolase n=1 Tax=Pikeienuella piscinae TaxID=2748098 RepID=A0A7L5BSX4_9RHOB|nr:hydroxyacylglutathione hydrolase [Pikeienuella piscinae]QIE54850.1 hydroxyacylglutathione hydrolase [Pikeienuella piscinae]
MSIETIVIPCREDNYGYILRDAATGVVAVVDAPEATPLIAALEERGWGLDLILLTHHHHDHIDGVEALRSRFGAKVFGAAADAHRLPPLDRELAEGDEVAVGESAGRVIDVSGHTVGHVAYLFDGSAFTADSLMALGCGRVFEGTHLMMWESLSKFLGLPPETLIYSGHNYGAANGRFALSIEPENDALRHRIERISEADAAGKPICPTTLAEELATNPFLRAREPGVKAAVGLDGADDAGVFAEIRRRKDRF